MASDNACVDQLLVEGKDDQHVIWAICKEHEIPELFSVQTPSSSGGIDELLNSIPVRLKTSGIKSLGIVIDADVDLNCRWMAICSRLTQFGYHDIPENPSKNGTIIENEGLPRIGIWLMPDNTLPGMLENFVSFLIPEKDLLLPKAKAVIDEIEHESINRYPRRHRPKALIHTWLAWQEIPGQPMGLSITAHALYHNAPIALAFVRWMRRLFAE